MFRYQFTKEFFIMTYTYIPKGVCSRKMTVELNDDHTIQSVLVEGC